MSSAPEYAPIAIAAAKIALIDEPPRRRLKLSRVPKIGAAQIEKKMHNPISKLVIPQLRMNTRTESVSNFFMTRFLFVFY
jgi:hypothetical protein